MAKIRREINLLCAQYSATNAAIDASELAELDKAAYGGTLTFYFEIVARATAGSTGNITLRRKGTTTDDATIAASSVGASLSLVRSASFAAPASATEYFVHADAGGANKTITINAARIVILQDEAGITKTATQIEVGNNETGKTNNTTQPLASPKYWKYNSGNWDGSVTFAVEVVFNRTNTMDTTTIYLQEDNGSFANWGTGGNQQITIVNASTTTTVTRTRVTFTPVNGRHYRIASVNSTTMSGHTIYCAKIIVTQAAVLLEPGSAFITKMEAEYLLANTKLAAGTNNQDFLTKWDSTEWSSVTNTYNHVVDAAASSTSVIDLRTAGGTQLTNSAVTSPNNRGVSANITMPADQNIDCRATTNNGDVYASRLSVLCVVPFGPLPLRLSGMPPWQSFPSIVPF